MGFICALLLLVITLQHISITAERDLLKTYKNTVEELSHTISSLQHNNTGLQLVFVSLQIRVDDLSAQNNQLQNNFSSLSLEKLELENRVTSLTNELREKTKQGNLCGPVCFFKSNEAKSWSDSRQFCRDHGADLVIINTEEKQKLIMSSIDERVWIGLSDTEDEGNMTWVDNSPLNQGFWMEWEPNNADGNEDCVELMLPSHAIKNWNDLKCSEMRKGICEK
ncbi:C-type lectin lectoxin-Thr1-like [Danio aesculapii]|uniref:C-type lectin lectoxin-Thr1-like n=1 Tax=Danio aesculapii TaxID=1142201 RepID=UPI0024C08C2D|nr:C-type lectin lectoxin-Thr1-like [Danio aesculapii]